MTLEAGGAGYRWRILALVYLCQLSFALVFQSIPPILRLIIGELGLSHAQGGSLMSLFALPGVFLAIPAGIISDRIGVRRIALVSLSLMIGGTLLVGLSESFLLLSVGRIVSGVGSLTLAIILPPILSRWFTSRELGQAMGIFNTGMPLAIIVSFNVLGAAGASLGWRVPIFLTTASCVISLLAFLVFFKEQSKGGDRVDSSSLPGVGWPIWLVGMAWAFFNASIISFLTFSQDFFVTRGFQAASAGSLTSTVMVGSLLLSPVVGYLVSRYGREEVFIAAGGLALTSLMLLMPTASSPIIVLAIFGAFAAFVPPPIFSLPSKIARPQNLGLAFGIVTACLNIGVLVGPYLVGLAKDLTGEYVAGFYLMSLFTLLQASVILLLYAKRRRKTVP